MFRKSKLVTFGQKYRALINEDLSMCILLYMVLNILYLNNNANGTNCCMSVLVLTSELLTVTCSSTICGTNCCISLAAVIK